MKRIFFLVLCAFGGISLNAQYRIDLSSTQPVSLKYLKMGHPGPDGKEIKVNNLYMEEGGVPLLPVMGEFHYTRMDHRYWKDALLKMKASGVTIVSTYVLWILHEEIEGRQCWTGNCNLRRFVQLCNELGLKVHLRIGPYCNAEIVNGALPDWIAKSKLFRSRSNDPLYLEYVRNWYKSIYQQIEGLLYKNGGPIMAVQLENEYVTKGMVISHLMNLKRIAVQEGFDVPLYSMTHWMDSEYPKGEIVPYAGFYIETPWVANGAEQNPPSNFEFFTYNRISDNIGTDLIKTEGGVASLDGSKNDSPFFTCEIGVGTATFYNRRAVVPEEMAGENINLRLGCGANLMGYYMYVGGTNPVGEKGLFAGISSQPIGYDYQAPIREFGTLGNVMKETKKLNYLMNDFGSDLAPKVAYLPTTNQDRNNLQWAVRSDGQSGYLFCSNYLYKHHREDYKKVQFNIRLKDEALNIPRTKVTVPDGAYFVWPFNLSLEHITLKYATAQPICTHVADNIKSYFFFADDDIPAEYVIRDTGVKEIQVSNGVCKKEQGGYYINALTPGMECVISIVQTDGKEIRLITLTEEESDFIWKGRTEGADFVAVTRSTLVYDDEKILLTDENPQQDIWMYQAASSAFVKQSYSSKETKRKYVTCHPLAPMSHASWIGDCSKGVVSRMFDATSLAAVSSVTLRYSSEGKATCLFNGTQVDARKMGDYFIADMTSLFKAKENQVCFKLENGSGAVLAEVEVIYKNGTRRLWNTNNTWLASDGKTPVQVLTRNSNPTRYAPEEHLAVYELSVPEMEKDQGDVRLLINFAGDIATAYIGDKMVNDHYYDGTDWILGVSRYRELLRNEPLVIIIKGFKSTDQTIYLETFANQAEGVFPHIKSLETRQEYQSVR